MLRSSGLRMQEQSPIDHGKIIGSFFCDVLPVVLFLEFIFGMQHLKRKSAMWGTLRDGIFPLTVHADESMVYHSYLALINLTT
jgi:hypothetical protein